MRVISLVPSITEFLFDLGMDEEVVGLTKFCIHPNEKWQQLPRVGGTKTVNHARVAALKPDLIIANKEENTREDVERLREHYTVLLTEVYTVEDAFAMMLELGDRVNRQKEATVLVDQVRREWEAARNLANGERVVYAIWNDPFMVAGTHTYIHSVLEWFGWTNAIETARYPEMPLAELVNCAPDQLMLSSEPFPFAVKHMEQFKAILPASRVDRVDGECFSWYGSRMLHTPNYVRKLVGDKQS